ncbi:MAG: phage holin family protein [Thermoanaerobaculia bacterium]|nr:phage holin family protein [Thermoanaerobaculia bacterium]
MKILVRILINGLGLLLVTRLVPGIAWPIDLASAGGLLTLLGGGVVLGLLNLLVKPILVLFSIPLLVVTLGLFYLVINGLVLKLADLFLDSLAIAGFWPAVVGGLVLSLFNLFVRWLVRD